MALLGVDTGGTFTDLVYLTGQEMRVHKVLSTPGAPEQAILQGIAEMGLDSQDLVIVHGSTVATNAVLEGKGVRTAYITNHGLGDVLTIGRQARRDLYDLQPQLVTPPVPAELCLEIGGRLTWDGAVLEDLIPDELEKLVLALHTHKPDAVAINLLFSYVDERFERKIESVIPKEIFVSRSSKVLPEQREYERGIATWLNSYVGPIMENYLNRLQTGLPKARINVMQSHGGAISAGQAAGHAVQLLLSGPAGGLLGARHVSSSGGTTHLLSFDMGGTSTDVALIDGEINLTSEGTIAGYPVAVPMVDMHTIGAGGGSIARVDTGGLLQVGPESAGADPGPACYARGGTVPTVTDANVVLGRLPGIVALGGTMPIDVAAAHRAVDALTKPLGCTLSEAAEGVIHLANEHMVQALRVISVQRGLDPRAYTLVSFGGAGGLHVCELAQTLGVKRALVPIHAGVLSALGMLVARPGRQLSRAVTRLLEELSEESVERELNVLAERGNGELKAEGIAHIGRRDSLDLRYTGQSYTLNVPWNGSITTTTAAFHRHHQLRFGHDLDVPIELVNVRVGLTADRAPPQLPDHVADAELHVTDYVPVVGVSERVPVYRRSQLAVDAPIRGPAVVTDSVGTTWVAPGWWVSLDRIGNLVLTFNA